MNLMMLCAGEGTRLRPYTATLPKPAIPFLNVPLVSFFLEWAREVPFETLCVNTHHLPAKIEELFKNLPLPAKELKISPEPQALLGSGGGLGHAARFLKGRGPVLLMNGDEIFFPSQNGVLKDAFESHRNAGRLATVVVMEHEEVGSKFGGVWVDDRNRVLGFAKKKRPDAARGYHYIGALWLDDRVFKYLPEDRDNNILYDALTQAMSDGEEVALHVAKGFWHESGNPADYLKATFAALEILQGSTNESAFLQKVLNRLSPGWRLEMRNATPVLLGAGAVLPSSCSVEGFAVLAAGAKVADGATLKEAVLAPQKQIALAGDLSGLIF